MDVRLVMQELAGVTIGEAGVPSNADRGRGQRVGGELLHQLDLGGGIPETDMHGQSMELSTRIERLA